MKRSKGAGEVPCVRDGATRSRSYSPNTGERAPILVADTPSGELSSSDCTLSAGVVCRSGGKARASWTWSAPPGDPGPCRFRSARAAVVQRSVVASRSTFRGVTTSLFATVATVAASFAFRCIFCFLTLSAFADGCSTRPRQQPQTASGSIGTTAAIDYGIRFNEPCPEAYQGYCFNGGNCYTTISIDRRRIPVCACLPGWKGRQCDDVDDPEVYYSRMQTEFETAAISSVVTFVIVATCCASFGMYIYRRCLKINIAMRSGMSPRRFPADDSSLAPFSPKRIRGSASRSSSHDQRVQLNEVALEAATEYHGFVVQQNPSEVPRSRAESLDIDNGERYMTASEGGRSG